MTILMIEIERTDKIIETLSNTNGKGLIQLYLKSDVILLADVFKNLIKVSIKVFDINPLYYVGVPRYTSLCGLKHTNTKLQTLQEKAKILLLESNM